MMAKRAIKDQDPRFSYDPSGRQYGLNWAMYTAPEEDSDGDED